jgi:CBS domain containing-hemolysin-like protein
MTPLLLFLLGCALTYLGTVSAAFNALMRLSLRIHAERTDRDDILGPYLEDPRRLFIPVRLLTSTLTVVTAVLLARVTGVDRTGLPVLVFSMFGIVLACEHLIPLLVVRQNPEAVLDFLLPSFEPILRLLRPLTVGLLRVGTNGHRRSQSGVRKAVGSAKGLPAATPVETAPQQASRDVQAQHEAQQEAQQEGQARELLRNLADFRETMVREVMTPRPDIVAIASDATIDQLYNLFREQGYSRIPVFKETLDNVQGFVFVKDLIQRGLPGGTAITPLVRPAHFVPETKRVPDLLKEFQRRRVQIAIVVDEYGGTAGLVTAEDLIEEIVGEIRDEYDVEMERIVDEGQGRFLLSGSVHVDEMANLMKVNIDGHGFETVGGYLLSRLGRVPAVGEHLEVDGLGVEVVDTQQRRITRVRMSRLDHPTTHSPRRGDRDEPVPAVDGQRQE